jgi:hypothetical protein
MSDATTAHRESLYRLGVFALSAAILLLSIGQVRVLSFQLWHHVTYLVVTVTLLGFAAGGTYASLRTARDSRQRAAWQALLFAFATLGVFAVLARHGSALLEQKGSQLPALDATFSYLYLILPFVFGGLSIAAALDGTGEQVSKRYGANLAGSAAGCLLVFPTLALGGAGLVLTSAALGAFSACLLAFASNRRALGAIAGIAGILALAALPARESLFPFTVARGKALSQAIELGRPVPFTGWDPICRVDVVGDPTRDPVLNVFQDGDAPTWIPSGRVDYSLSLPGNHYGLGYAMGIDPKDTKKAPRQRALIIGVGGGGDLKTALVMGTPEVVGAEINPTTAAMMRGPFKEFSGGLYDDPRVTIEIKDGRAVVAAAKKKFDQIQITGADTYAALASGANLTAESYLYTEEAVRDYLEHLTDNGVLCVLRWRFFPPREELRFVGMCAKVLRQLGAEDPRRHIAVVNVSATGDILGQENVGAHYALTIVKRTPLSDYEVSFIRKFVNLHPRKGAYGLAFLPGEKSEPEFAGYLDAIAGGEATTAKFEADYRFAIDTVTDDRPFFFQFFRLRSLFEKDPNTSDQSYFHAVIGNGPAGLQVLWFSLLGALALVILFVFAPLAIFRRSGLAVSGAKRSALFFVCVGLAYLAIEMATVQRLTLFLGHPLKALGVGLSTFLLGSGLGAAFTGRVATGAESGRGRFAALLVALLALAHAFLLPAFFAACEDFGPTARTVLAIAAIAPLAFVMGMPFPLGLRAVQQTAPPLLPWALGVNGGASVIASVGAILVAMEIGFRAVLLIAAAIYVLAAITMPRTRSVTA